MSKTIENPFEVTSKVSRMNVSVYADTLQQLKELQDFGFKINGITPTVSEVVRTAIATMHNKYIK